MISPKGTAENPATSASSTSTGEYSKAVTVGDDSQDGQEERDGQDE